MRLAALTIDLDPLGVYLRNRGLEPRSETRMDAVITDALPRYLELLDGLGIRATFFVVASEIRSKAKAEVLARVAQAGHELANHGLDHVMAPTAMDRSALKDQVLEADGLLRTIVDRVHGFRSPGWNVDPRLFAILAAAGYRYDSSLVPLPGLNWMSRARPWLGRWLPPSALKLQDRWPRSPVRPYPMDLDQPWRRGSSRLWEIPCGASAFPPAPLSTTVSAMLGDGLANWVESWASLAPAPLVVVMHGVDLVDFQQEIHDPRLSAKPGLTDPLPQKRARIERMIRNLGRGRQWVRLQELVP